MSSIWKDKSLKPSGNYISFDAQGDNINGAKILAIGTHTWPPRDGKDERTVPKLTLEHDGETKVWTVGQVNAISRLFELEPDVGDVLTRCELTGVRKEGGKTYKDFTIEVATASSSQPSAEDLA